MQTDAIAESFKQISNWIPTLTLCGLVFTASKVIAKVNHLSTEVLRLRRKVHTMSNIIVSLSGRLAPSVIERLDEDEEVLTKGGEEAF